MTFLFSCAGSFVVLSGSSSNRRQLHPFSRLHRPQTKSLGGASVFVTRARVNCPSVMVVLGLATSEECGSSPVWHLESAQAAERLHAKASVFFLPFGTRDTIRFFCCFAPAVLCAPIWTKKNLLKTPCLPSVFFVCFFDVFHARFFGFLVICRCYPKMESPKSCIRRNSSGRVPSTGN